MDCVELVAEGEVVLVSLLDFEDLSLQLRDQEVLLIAGEVHGVVVLYRKEKMKKRGWTEQTLQGR